jgi:hypothetical protein
VLLVIFRIGRSAVNAPEIAAVSDRNSQVGDLPAEFVLQRHVRKSPTKPKARFGIGIGRTRRKIFPVLRSFPIQPYSVTGWRDRAFRRIACGRPRRFRLEPSFQISGSPRRPWVVSPCRPPRSELQGRVYACRQSAANLPKRFLTGEFVAFIAPPATSGFYGNVGRNTYIGPALATWDFCLLKDTTIRERPNLQFRAEIFNLLNHANFNAPNLIVFTPPTATNRPVRNGRRHHQQVHHFAPGAIRAETALVTRRPLVLLYRRL